VKRHADGYENGGHGYEHVNGSARKLFNGNKSAHKLINSNGIANRHTYGNGKSVVNGNADRPRSRTLSFFPHRLPEPQSLTAIIASDRLVI
jgi:hypothetical protein